MPPEFQSDDAFDSFWSTHGLTNEDFQRNIHFNIKLIGKKRSPQIGISARAWETGVSEPKVVGRAREFDLGRKT
jgi:hypothetical protein